MTDSHDLTERNADFAASRFLDDLTINPSGNMMVIGCVDPRVDPTHVLGLKQGEAAVIRNVGGRITPATLRTMVMLGKVGQAHQASRHAGDWNLVILHHTDCGMTDLAPFPDLLAEYFEIPADELKAKAARGQWNELPLLITDEMLDRFVLRGAWADLPEKVLQKYDGLLDRVSYYFPIVPGENEDGWRSTVEGFKR